MAKHPKTGIATPSFVLRRGEGTPVSVVSRLVTGADGSSRQTHGINLSEAEVPTRRYLAETCAVEYENDLVRLMFAQRRRSSADLRSLVIVVMTPLATVHFLESIKSMKSPTLSEIAEKYKFAPEKLADIKQEPDQTIELVANIVAAAFSGREACLDFYHASSFAFVAVKTTNRLALEPIVRVDMRTSLFNLIVQRLRELQSDFPSDAILVKEDK